MGTNTRADHGRMVAKRPFMVMGDQPPSMHSRTAVDLVVCARRKDARPGSLAAADAALVNLLINKDAPSLTLSTEALLGPRAANDTIGQRQKRARVHGPSTEMKIKSSRSSWGVHATGVRVQ
jgi:hypothetical protein